MTPLNTIAHIRSDFPTKFGVPRQSGLVETLQAKIIFAEKYRRPEALRGLETFSHIWLLWGFSQSKAGDWSPTVRPPRLGGNTRIGVFATRSPYRPNSIGLSCVKIEKIDLQSPVGPILHVLGADLTDGTPIYDIKPYLPYTDSHPEASGGFAAEHSAAPLHVRLDNRWPALLPAESAQTLHDLLAHDPRPSYQQDPARVYGLEYKGLEVKFSVDGDILTVLSVEPRAAAPD